VAAHGYYVVAPDYFMGDPYVSTNASDPLQGLTTWIVKHPPVRLFFHSYILQKKKIENTHYNKYCI
jgi:hypothetical protein